MQISGRVVIVTGAGGPGCGRAIARRFARAAASVVVSDIDPQGGLETVRSIEAENGRAVFVSADVSVEADVRALVATAEHTYGGVDVLVNNASALLRPAIEHWAGAVHVDLLGPIYGVRYGVEAMRRRGGGAIVNVSSTSALAHGRQRVGSPGYDAAKAGVLRLTTALAYLHEREGIRVNCLVPHWIATPEVKSYWDSLTPEQRGAQDVPDVLITVEEIAEAVLRLATDEALAGRVLVYWPGQPPRLIPFGDSGYVSLE
jgi:NAD(P)-dependent dehydrogenase (short-subunit alcohol dehydrogenase family)